MGLRSVESVPDIPRLRKDSQDFARSSLVTDIYEPYLTTIANSWAAGPVLVL